MNLHTVLGSNLFSLKGGEWRVESFSNCTLFFVAMGGEWVWMRNGDTDKKGEGRGRGREIKWKRERKG